MMEPPEGMCWTAFWARLIIPTMLTMNVFSRRSLGMSQKFSTASPCRAQCKAVTSTHLRRFMLILTMQRA